MKKSLIELSEREYSREIRVQLIGHMLRYGGLFKNVLEGELAHTKGRERVEEGKLEYFPHILKNMGCVNFREVKE